MQKRTSSSNLFSFVLADGGTIAMIIIHQQSV